MLLETISAIILGALAIIGLYDLVSIIEEKIIKTYKSKKATVVISLDNNDNDVEYAMKCALHKLIKANISKDNSLYAVGNNLDEEKEKIAESVAKNYSNIFYSNEDNLNIFN